MKFVLCIVALTFLVSVEAVPAPLSSAIVQPTNEEDYFKEKLKSIQGALTDTINAGKDMQIMEAKLQNIVNLSSHFWRAESATEYATDRNAYGNLWKTGKLIYKKFCCKNFQSIITFLSKTIFEVFTFYNYSMCYKGGL